MDNPQHYQPLSHALHPPMTQPAQGAHYAVYDNTSGTLAREEEEEEEGEDEDEGLVEEQLANNGQAGSSRPSPDAEDPASDPANAKGTQEESGEPNAKKRRPGRPRGSKNRKARVPATFKTKPDVHQAKAESQWQQPGQQGFPQNPDVNPQNQQYYEFQWRVLQLCAEFYSAAEELVKRTPPLVVAQCYQMGPGAKVDPLSMLRDAKNVCDNLLANPVQLIAHPPPPIYAMVPNYIQHHFPPPPVPVPSSSSPQAANPPAFAHPLGAVMPVSQFGTYPTAPYYQYQYPGGPYYPPPPPPAHAASTTPAPQFANTSGHQGAWSDEEVERLKRLADESKAIPGGETEQWDWVINQWGNSRTRHQILIKATTVGLKTSSTRTTGKRRRETDGSAESASPAPPRTMPAPNTAPSVVASPVAGSSTAPSPQLRYPSTPRPPSTAPAASTTPAMPFPMPTVASTTSPAMSQQVASSPDNRRTSYYRPGPSDATPSGSGSKPSSSAAHPFMYSPNGAKK